MSFGCRHCKMVLRNKNFDCDHKCLLFSIFWDWNKKTQKDLRDNLTRLVFRHWITTTLFIGTHMYVYQPGLALLKPVDSSASETLKSLQTAAMFKIRNGNKNFLEDMISEIYRSKHKYVICMYWNCFRWSFFTEFIYICCRVVQNYRPFGR